jgi:hypothetical protein
MPLLNFLRLWPRARSSVPGHAEQAAREIEQLADRQVVVEVRGLRQEADARARRAARDLVAEDRGGTARRPDQAHQRANRRGLAGAVRPDEAEDMAALDRERDAAERFDLLASKRRAEGLRQILDRDRDISRFVRQAAADYFI